MSEDVPCTHPASIAPLPYFAYTLHRRLFPACNVKEREKKGESSGEMRPRPGCQELWLICSESFRSFRIPPNLQNGPSTQLTLSLGFVCHSLVSSGTPTGQHIIPEDSARGDEAQTSLCPSLLHHHTRWESPSPAHFLPTGRQSNIRHFLDAHPPWKGSL